MFTNSKAGSAMEALKPHIPGMILGIVATLILSGFGYVWVIRDNSKDLEHLSQQMSALESRQKEHIGRLETNLKESGEQLGKLRIFIATMHPERYTNDVGSAQRLKDLPPEDLDVFATSMSKYSAEYQRLRERISALEEDRLKSILDAIDRSEDSAVANAALSLGVAPPVAGVNSQLESINEFFVQGKLETEDLDFALQAASADDKPSKELEGEKKRLLDAILKDYIEFTNQLDSHTSE